MPTITLLEPETYAIATGLILVVSLLFSMLGLGGGMLYVPIFKWLGLPLKSVAIPLGLLLNGITTLSAFIRYRREGLVDFRGGLPAAAAGLVFAPVGAHLVQYVPRDILIAVFAVVVSLAGLRTLAQSVKGEPRHLLSPSPHFPGFWATWPKATSTRCWQAWRSWQ